MKIVLFTIFFYTVQSAASSDTEELGKGIYLPKTNLLGDFPDGEASFFEPLPPTCFRRTRLHYSGSNFEYYPSTKAFYKTMAVGATLQPSLQSAFTLGVTLSSLTQKVDSKETNFSGISLIVRAFTEKVLLVNDCLIDETISTLKLALVNDFEKLPLIINMPCLKNSWKAYDIFLKKYGSHVITSVKRGSSISQTTFAESSTSHSQRDFQVKSCITVTDPNDIGNLGVSSCANVSKSEISSVTNKETENKLIIRGGTKETRNLLMKNRTHELIKKLLNTAGERDASVEHTFSSSWYILQSRFDFGSDRQTDRQTDRFRQSCKSGELLARVFKLRLLLRRKRRS